MLLAARLSSLSVVFRSKDLSDTMEKKNVSITPAETGSSVIKNIILTCANSPRLLSTLSVAVCTTNLPLSLTT